MRKRISIAAVGFLAAAFSLVALGSCAEIIEGCEYTATCQDGGSGGEGAGGSATGGQGGSDGGALTGGMLGEGAQAGTITGGSGGLEGGAGGAGGSTAPCDGSCGGEKPVCDETANACVGCLGNTDCAAPTPVCYPSAHVCVECISRSQCGGKTPACDTMTHTCVECNSRSDCKAPTSACVTETHSCAACASNTDCKAPTPLCEMTSHTCVACVQSSDCKGLDAARCDPETHACTACSSDADCEHLAKTPACFEGTCVECTGKNNSACGVDSASGEPFVCDSLKRTCSTQTEHSADRCQPCVSDASCVPGQLCVLDTFEAKEIGYFCHWKKGDIQNGAPAECFPAGRPYVREVMSATSIDGETADICTLALSTCPARNQFRTKDCVNMSAADDTLCGVSPPNDAKCEQVNSTTFRCTMPCLSDEDCPVGSACDMPRQVCKL